MTGPGQPIFEIPRPLWEQMRAHVAQQAPEEACGLVGGPPPESSRLGRGAVVVPVTNLLRSPVRYKMEPREQLQAFDRLDQNGWDLLAIYHSHPHGPTGPSATDVAESYYPGVVYLIWSAEAGDWACRGFLIDPERIREVHLRLIEA